MKLSSLLCILFSIVIVIVLTSNAFFDRPCSYCSNTPTKIYRTSNKTYFFACSECSSKCAFCGAKATKHYTNLLGKEVFACRECFDNINS